MTTQDRAGLLQAVAELCERYPHWRLGQLVSNLAGWANVDVWEAEDDQLLTAARTHLDQLAIREQQAEV